MEVLFSHSTQRAKMLIPADWLSPMYIIIPRAVPMKTVQRDRLKNTVNNQD